MKKIPFLLVLLLIGELVANAQCIDNDKPLNQYAFRRMMRNHFRYTILGNEAPVSGFKVETDKPTISLKGNIFKNREDDQTENENSLIINLELTGGLSDDMQTLFSGGKLNGYFKTVLGFNFLKNSGNNARFVLSKNSNPFEWNIRRAKICEYYKTVAKQIDTAMTMLTLKAFVNSKNENFDVFVDSVVRRAKQSENTINKYSQPEKDRFWFRPFGNTDDSLKLYYSDFAKNLLTGYYDSASFIKDKNLLADFIKKIWRKSDSLNHERLLADTKSAEQFRKRLHKYDLINQHEIETYEDIWTSKRITWFNISLSTQNAAFSLYNAQTFSLTDSNSFTPGISVTYNYYSKRPKDNRFLYFRTGISITRNNSLQDLQSIDYTKTSTLVNTTGDDITSEESGKAYQGELKHGLGVEIPFECYLNPWIKQSIPGIYGKLAYQYGQRWINQNKIALELGFIWNFKNDDEEAKNMLSVIPFFSWSNLLKEYKEPQKINSTSLGERFSIGVKFGVPINMGKRVQPGS